MNIIENNLLIAEFMGAIPDGRTEQAKKENILVLDVVAGSHKKEELKFHESWAWLMPVIEKIQKELYVVTMMHTLIGTIVRVLPNHDETDSIVHARGFDDTGDSKKAYYQAVVEFINWFNEEG
jgi:hypothetical protein